MAVGHDTSGLPSGSYHYIRGHLDALTELPPPEERWTYHDISDSIHTHLQKLRADGSVVVEGETDDGYKLFSVDERAYQIIKECSQARETLPCGHTGVKNIGDGLLTCGFDGCSHKYTRDTMQLLLES